MKSIDFLTDYFNSYYPKDVYIYSVFFIILEDREVSNIDDLHKQIDIIEQNITKNDINLLINFSSDIDNIDFLSRLFLNLTRIFMPNIFKNIVLEELYYMKLYTHNNDRQKIFNLLNYYFPYENTNFDLNPYNRFKPSIYYSIRAQLLSNCKTKEEIIDKLKYNEEFKFYITQRFYDENKEILNKKVFEKRVYDVCYELLSILELDSESIKNNYYEKVDSYKKFVKTKFGI